MRNGYWFKCSIKNLFGINGFGKFRKRYEMASFGHPLIFSIATNSDRIIRLVLYNKIDLVSVSLQKGKKDPT